MTHTFFDHQVLLKNGPYGYYVQLGEDRKNYVPKRASLSHVCRVEYMLIEVLPIIVVLLAWKVLSKSCLCILLDYGLALIYVGNFHLYIWFGFLIYWST